MFVVKHEPARKLYDAFCDTVRCEYVADKVAEGEFGAYMKVSMVRYCTLIRLFLAFSYLLPNYKTGWLQVNDGPVTMIINSKDRKPTKV